MSTNYRSSPAKKTSTMSPMITGVVIGLILGVLLALGFAIWLNRNATPFVEKSKSVELLPTRPPRPDAPKGDVVQPTPTTPAGVAREGGDKNDKPRFEFYQTLPGNKDSTTGDGTKGNKTGKAADAPAKTVAKPDAAPKPTTQAADGDATKAPAKESYSLQAGAFQSESDAENLKAKIAFAGMEANVRSVNLPDKGTLYRVRLGPYRSMDEVNRLKAVLSQNGISAAVVKSE